MGLNEDVAALRDGQRVRAEMTDLNGRPSAIEGVVTLTTLGLVYVGRYLIPRGADVADFITNVTVLAEPRMPEPELLGECVVAGTPSGWESVLVHVQEGPSSRKWEDKFCFHYEWRDLVDPRPATEDERRTGQVAS